MSQRSYDSFNWRNLANYFFLIGRFPSLASNFEFKNKLKSPAKINFSSKVTSKFSKSEGKLFKTETCSDSVLALYKFIRTKPTSLIVTSRINIRPSLSDFWLFATKFCVPI